MEAAEVFQKRMSQFVQALSAREGLQRWELTARDVRKRPVVYDLLCRCEG